MGTMRPILHCAVIIASLVVVAAPVSAQSRRSVEALMSRRDSLQRAIKVLDDSIAAAQPATAAGTQGGFSGTTTGYTPTLGKVPGEIRILIKPETRLPVVGVELDPEEPTWVYWVVRHTDGDLYYIADADLKVHRRDEALAAFAARRQVSPLMILGVSPAGPNSAGGVEMSIVVRNTDARRTVKYLYFGVTPYNAVGDVVRSRIGDAATRLQITGPVAPNGAIETSHWEPVWYNSTIVCVVLTHVTVEYTDGTTRSYTRDLPSILHPVIKNSCSYRAKKP